MATTTFPKATEDQFEANRFRTTKDKAMEVNAVVAFLKAGMPRSKFTKRVYHFFHQTLSMSAEYDIDGFYAHHFQSNATKRHLLEDTRRDVRRYAGLDADRNADIAFLFASETQRRNRETGEWDEGGLYADLLEPQAHGL